MPSLSLPGGKGHYNLCGRNYEKVAITYANPTIRSSVSVSPQPSISTTAELVSRYPACRADVEQYIIAVGGNLRLALGGK